MGNGGVLGNDDDAVPDVIILVVHLLRLAFRRDAAVVPNARVLVDDGIGDLGVAAHPDARHPLPSCWRMDMSDS